MRSSRISDATHLRMLKANGAFLCAAPMGEFWAIFDAQYAAAGDDPAIDGTSPALTLRTTDVEALQLATRGTVITFGDLAFKVARHEPDGTGESVLFLVKG